MKMFIFRKVEECSPSYHSDGGVVIVAEDRDTAGHLADQQEYLVLCPSDWDKADVYELKGAYVPYIYIFPNAGCC